MSFDIPGRELIQRKLSGYLPNPQILNFYEGIPHLPESLGDLRLMVGAGDLSQIGDVPNTQYFRTYNVFLCQPWNIENSLVNNVEYLLTTPGRYLCFLDFKNPEHIKAFETLFAGRFSFIDGFGGHCPHFKMSSLHFLLSDGGTVANVFERSPNVVTEEVIERWIEPYIQMPENNNEITGELRLKNPSKLPELTERLRQSVLLRQVNCKQVHIDEARIKAAEINELKTILRVQMLDRHMPYTLTGHYIMIKKDWSPEPYKEFIITKHFQEYGIIEAYEAEKGSNDTDVKRVRKLIDILEQDIRIGSSSLHPRTDALFRIINKFKEHFSVKNNRATGGSRKNRRKTLRKKTLHKKTLRSN